MNDADLAALNLAGLQFNTAILTGADLQDADLQGADLQGADLQGADLRDAGLSAVVLAHARLQGAGPMPGSREPTWPTPI